MMQGSTQKNRNDLSSFNCEIPLSSNVYGNQGNSPLLKEL